MQMGADKSYCTFIGTRQGALIAIDMILLHSHCRHCRRAGITGMWCPLTWIFGATVYFGINWCFVISTNSACVAKFNDKWCTLCTALHTTARSRLKNKVQMWSRVAESTFSGVLAAGGTWCWWLALVSMVRASLVLPVIQLVPQSHQVVLWGIPGGSWFWWLV